MEDLIIYKAWPGEEIDRAISEFNEQMHGGAEPEEIAAGIHGLDFLTRASQLTGIQQARLEGALLEGEMRVELLGALKASKRSERENLDRAISAVRALQRNLKHISEICMGPEQVIVHVERMTLERGRQ